MSRPTVLTISSQVAYGHVGNSASVVALQSLGCEVIDIPTIILSSHPGHGPAASVEISAKKIDGILSSLKDQGRLDKVDVILSGYLRSRAQIRSVARAVKTIKAKNLAAIYCCDPIIGDEATGIYVPEHVAQGIKTHLINLSDFITPNLFEFQFLCGHKGLKIDQCIDLARNKFKTDVLITSAPLIDPAFCGNLLVTAQQAWVCETSHICNVPHGTGDLFTALFVGHFLSKCPIEDALSRATGQLNSVLINSADEGTDELCLAHLFQRPDTEPYPPATMIDGQ